MTLSNLSGLLPHLPKALISQAIPGILKGALINVFDQKNVDIIVLRKWVEDDVSLWGMISPQYQNYIRNFAPKLGNVDWFTPDWLIDAVREKYPAVASLFMGWDKASNWLKRQAAEIKAGIFHPRS